MLGFSGKSCPLVPILQHNTMPTSQPQRGTRSERPSPAKRMEGTLHCFACMLLTASRGPRTDLNINIGATGYSECQIAKHCYFPKQGIRRGWDLVACFWLFGCLDPFAFLPGRPDWTERTCIGIGRLEELGEASGSHKAFCGNPDFGEKGLVQQSP